MIFLKIFNIIEQIPYGKVTTYGLIAESIGSKSGARMVGTILKKHPPEKSHLPYHRVVNSIGVLTGKNMFGVNNEMQNLLEGEGLKIKNNKIVNFIDYLWVPPSVI